MMKRLGLLVLLLGSLGARAELQTVCRLAGGVHVPPGDNGAVCAVGNEAPPEGIANTDPAWIYSGINLPHPTGPTDRACFVLDTVSPYDYTEGWSANVAILFARLDGASATDDVNMTARLTFLGADGGQDIRGPRWGDPGINDDTPNGSTQMSLFEPYVTTFHDIPYPVGRGGLNVPSVRRNMAIMICRENGPNADMDGVNETGDEEDNNAGTIRATQAFIRWEDASNVVQSATFVPLTTTEQVEVTSTTLPQVNRSLIGYQDAQYKAFRAVTYSPIYVPMYRATAGACAVGSGGTWPTCNDTRWLPGVTLHEGGEECVPVNAEFPADYIPGTTVKVDAVVSPSASGNNLYFTAAAAPLTIGSALSVSPSFNTVLANTSQSCNANTRQVISFDGISVAGGSPGDGLLLKFCRPSQNAADTSTADVNVLGFRLWFKREIQLEEVVE